MHLSTGPMLLMLLVSLSALFHGCSFSTAEECSGMGMRLRSFRVISNCNFTTLSDKQKKEIQAPTTILFIPILYVIAFTIGLPANLLAFWVLLFRTKKLPSTILLINLTITDLMLLLVLPFRIVYHFQGNDWGFGEPFCRIVTALFYGNMYGSVLCLTLVAMDRYVALVHPFGAKTLRSRRTSIYMSLGVWAVTIAAMLPLLISPQSYKLDDPNIITCHDAIPEEEQKNYFLPYFASLFAVCFLLPFLVILCCYAAILNTLVAAGRRYTHAVRVTVLVLVAFIACFLPSNILLLVHYTDSYMYLTNKEEDLYVPYMVSLAVSTFNSCIDPFIFYYVSDDFREKVRRALCCQDVKANSSSENKETSSSGTMRSKVTLLSKFSQSMTSSLQEEKV